MISDVWLRTLSFTLATALSVNILLFPLFYTDITGKPNHGLLMMLLFGICLAYIHAVGFKPKHIGWATLISPLISWPIMILGLAFSLL